MNAIKRFIDLLKSPLIPVRLFAVEDDFDFSELGDEPAGYYDVDGNYLGDDAAAAEAAAMSHDDPSLNSDNWDEYSDDFGGEWVQYDGNGNIIGAQARDEDGKMQNNNQTRENYAADRLDTRLKELDEIEIKDYETRKEVQDAKEAAIGQYLVDSGIITEDTPAKDKIEQLEKYGISETALPKGYGLNSTSVVDAAKAKISKGFTDLLKDNPRTSTGGQSTSRGTVQFQDNKYDNGKTLRETSYTSNNTPFPETTAKSGTTRNYPESEATPEATPVSSKSDPVITNNPFDKGEPGISIPKGPLEGTPLAGTGLPGHESEPTKEDAEDRGFNNDDSGSDTMEETSQDAPTSGLGGDTFVNPNDDSRHGWGLGEEDPNKANYDVDKWNRGMERVSTDVVSDEKCKNFIKKTFKDDPVLIKTVRIMKSL